MKNEEGMEYLLHEHEAKKIAELFEIHHSISIPLIIKHLKCSIQKAEWICKWIVTEEMLKKMTSQ